VAALKTVITIKRLPKTRSGKILRATMRKIADRERRCAGGACGGAAGRHPFLPNRVHGRELARVGQPDLGCQQVCPVGAGLGQKRIDARQDFRGLDLDGRTPAIGHLS
jgi:hypothetical protein